MAYGALCQTLQHGHRSVEPPFVSRLLALISADMGQVIATLPIGDHVDATAFDAESKLIFNSNGEGTINVIHEDGPDKYSPFETVKTVPRAKTMALDTKTHQLFLSTSEGSQFEYWWSGNNRT